MSRTEEYIQILSNLFSEKCKLLLVTPGQLCNYYNVDYVTSETDNDVIVLVKNYNRRNYFIQMYNTNTWEKRSEYPILWNSLYEVINENLHEYVIEDQKLLLTFKNGNESEMFHQQMTKIIKICNNIRNKKINNSFQTENMIKICSNDKLIIKTDNLAEENENNLLKEVDGNFSSDCLDASFEKTESNEETQSLLRRFKSWIDKSRSRSNSPNSPTCQEISSPITYKHLSHIGFNNHFFQNPNDDTMKAMVKIYQEGQTNSVKELEKENFTDNKQNENSKFSKEDNMIDSRERPILPIQSKENETGKSFLPFVSKLFSPYSSSRFAIKKLDVTTFYEDIINFEDKIDLKKDSELLPKDIRTTEIDEVKELNDKSNNDIPVDSLEDQLYFAAINEDEDNFNTILKNQLVEPHFLANGETLFTSFLMENRIKFCLKLLQCNDRKIFANYRNKEQQTPLQVAIKMGLNDIVDLLIFETDLLNNEDINGETALMELCDKISVTDDETMKCKLLSTIKSVIRQGGDIYQITSHNRNVINSCTNHSLRSAIEIFNKEEKYKSTKIIKRVIIEVEKMICQVCLDRKVDCNIECGHTFCMVCTKELFQCPFCKHSPIRPKRLYFS